MYFYLKAIHIIFIVTWFAGLFYMPRLLIYNREAQDKEPVAAGILTTQFTIMIRRLWYGITWPSAVITFIMGHWVLIAGGWHKVMLQPEGRWLLIKYILVYLLYAYHFSLQVLLKQHMASKFNYSSQQLRIWNEVATIFLIAIVFLVSVKQAISFILGIAGLIVLLVILMSAIRIYKMLRDKNGNSNLPKEKF
ncbi:MAG: CopD family protein [Bacteroidota bacterium]